MKQVRHIYFEGWEPDFKEFIRNIRSRNLIMKNEKESVQNSALVLLIGREIVFGAFKSEIFLLLSEKCNESEYSYQSWSPEFYGRTSKSDSATKILLDDLQPRTISIKKINSLKRNQNTTTKVNATEIIGTTFTITSRWLVWKSTERDSVSCLFIVSWKTNLK